VQLGVTFKGDKDIKRIIMKNINGCLFNLSLLQEKFPLFFYKSLGNYLQLHEYVLNNIEAFNDEKIIKCNLIAMRKLNRSFSIKISLFKYRE
jgi:hypothetical protein